MTLVQKQTQAPRCSMCKGVDTLTGFVIKEVLCVTVLPKLAGLVYTHQHHCCYSFDIELFLWLIWKSWNTFYGLKWGNAHELMLANAWCHYLVSRIYLCAILLNSRTWKGWSDIFVSEKRLEEARWVNKFATDDSALQVKSPKERAVGFSVWQTCATATDQALNSRSGAAADSAAVMEHWATHGPGFDISPHFWKPGHISGAGSGIKSLILGSWLQQSSL